MNDYLEDFLIKYVENHTMDCERNFQNICRFLCENYFYNPKDDKLKFIAFGYFLAKSDDEAKANCNTGLLILKLNEIYKVVAEENNWTDK